MEIQAVNKSISIGGRTEQNIIIGVPPENVEELVRLRTKDLANLTDSQKETIALLKEKLDLNERQLRAVFGILGEANVQPEQLAAKLVEIAEQINALRAENEMLRRGPPALAAIAEEVQALIDKGEFDDARRALVHGREASRALRIDASRYEAAFLAQDARVDDLQLSYRSAAAKYAEAAGIIAPFDKEQQWRFLLAQAVTLRKQGDEFGDNAALIEAIEIYRRCLALVPRSERPLDWATARADLGRALKVLGERQSETALLEEAVCAYREASQELKSAPLLRAATQVNLGNALQELGKLGGGTEPLKEAVSAYKEALQELPRDRDPLLWAATKMNLGNALETLSARENGTTLLDEAVAVYRESLKEATRERVPLKWAAAQTNLGVALNTLGDSTGSTVHLDEAVTAHREALQEFTRARVPLQWATTQMNLGAALQALGERESGTARLEEAVAAYRDALQENTRARVPLQWAMTQRNLAGAYRALYDKTAEPRHLDNALAAIAAALDGFRKAEAAFYFEGAKRLQNELFAARRK